MSSQSNDDDCHSCDALGVFKNSPFMQSKMKKTKPTDPPPPTTAANPIADDGTFWDYKEQPPDSIDLGRSTWTFLHTMAAYYPATPDQNKQRSMQALLHSLPDLYPCRVCAEDFDRAIKDNPPRVASGTELSQWLCETHNHVNAILGKPIFDCAKVDQRWKRLINNTLS